MAPIPDSMLPPPPPPPPKILFLGPMGHGKSTTANKISNSNSFTTGVDDRSVTQFIRIKSHQNTIAIDCPGFGDPTNEQLFMRQFLTKRAELLANAPINAFVLVIAFDRNVSAAFLDSAKQFVRCFGTEGIKSLLILCIQKNPARRYSDDEFQDIFVNSEGARFLFRKNNSQNLNMCLWENIHGEYPSQREKFFSIVNALPKFTDLHMKYAFDMIENQLE
jgi:predicted GTPase